MFVLPEVQKAFKDFIFVELYTDRGEEYPEDDQNAVLQLKRYGTSTLPLYVIQGPDGRVIDKFGGGRVTQSEVLAYLKKAPALGAAPSPTPVPTPASPTPSPIPVNGKPTKGAYFESLAPAEADSRASGRPLLIEFTGEN